MGQARFGARIVGEMPAATPSSVPFKVLNQKHPEYDAAYWRRLRAFYRGGKALLNDADIMDLVFPRHREEHPSVYEERKRRAFYFNYVAEIVDYVIAQLMAEPITMSLDGAKAAPAFYADFFKDVSPPGGERCPLHEFLRGRVLEALICRKAWTIVDMPSGEPEQFASQAEQEKAGALNSYLVPLATESVVDWETDDSGNLTMAVVYTTSAKRLSILDNRRNVTHSWRVWSPSGWSLYELRQQEGEALRDDVEVPLKTSGAHSFGRVPVVPLCLPDGLWALNKLESAAREHFNKRSALGWAEYQSLLQELYEFLAPTVSGSVINENAEDPGRARAQRRGQGYVQVRGNEDKAQFIGPDPASFKEGRESCNETRDEMHRVMHQMALSVDNSGAALQRSGDSKARDQASATVVLNALGAIVRSHAVRVLDMVSTGRGETLVWQAKGLDQFDNLAPAQVIDQASVLETVPIPSPTFQRRWKVKVAKAALADDLTPDDLKAIEDELEANITAEQFDEAGREDEQGEIQHERDLEKIEAKAKADAEAARAKAKAAGAGRK